MLGPHDLVLCSGTLLETSLREKVEAGMKWLQENMPGGLLVVRTAATRIEVPGTRDRAPAAFEWTLDTLGRYDAPDLVRAGVVLPRRSLLLRAPLGRPGKIVCVARNYPAHATERGHATPEEPVLFLKAPSAVIGPGDDIWIPELCR